LQGNRIKVNGKVGQRSQPLVTKLTKLVAYTTIWEAVSRRGAIPAEGAAYFVADATIAATTFGCCLDKGLQPLVEGRLTLHPYHVKQGNRIKMIGKVGPWSQSRAAKIVASTTIWEAAGRRSVISAEGAAHFVADATIFEVAFQIQ
jgi:hypothetical protein